MRLRFVLVLMIGLAGMPPTLSAGPRTVFTNVDVLTMSSPELMTGQVVIVEHGLIADFHDLTGYTPRPDDHVIDGDGGVLMPGLIDAHIHIDHPQDLRMLALYGVTTAINLRGLPWHLRLREAIRGGDMFAPDFITSGDYLDGDPPDMLPMASVGGVDAARRAVQLIQAAGYDFIKLYSELSADQFQAICEEARALGMGVVGHLVDAASLEDVLACPQLNIAHGEQLFKLLEDREDEAEIRRLIEALSSRSISLTTNRQLYHEMGRQVAELDQLLARPEAALIHPATFQPWRPGLNRYNRRDEAWAGRVQKVYADLAAVNRIAAEVDAQMLVAGTDMPVSGSYPGISLIDEIEAFKASGLDNYQALATATRNAARLVRRLQPDWPEIGVVRPGARADLVLLAANPLADLDTLRAPRGVMLRGAWYDASALAAVRAELRAVNERLTPRVTALEAAVLGRDLDAATALFKQYRAEDPGAVLFAQYVFFFYGFSLLYGDNGLTEDAEQARQAVLLYDMYRQTYPEVHSAHHVYGLALEASGDRAGASAAQRRALELWPDYPPARAALLRVETTVD